MASAMQTIASEGGSQVLRRYRLAFDALLYQLVL